MTWDNKNNYLNQLTSKTNKRLLKKMKEKTGTNITVLYQRILEYGSYKDYDDMMNKCVGIIAVKYYWDSLVSEYLNKEL